MKISYHKQKVGDVEVFYREAGPKDGQVILLLHGFPSSSHMFRDLIPRLAEDYRVIAPDLAGFGQTITPPRGQFNFTFDSLTQVMEGFTDALALEKYVLYVFDYGAPIGYRLAMAHPERIQAIISQNGNAYVEGFSDTWGPWENYWHSPTAENREACRESLTPETIRSFQYLHGTDTSLVSPDGYSLDIAYMSRPEAEEIQLDLIGDYRTNVDLYPDFQAYFRKYQPQLLAVWGKNDPAFLPAGAEAYKRDILSAEVHLLDTGHFALETHATEISELIHQFLKKIF
ncbi:alpha/beta fold hydrolase [Gracilibacillus alcaliphilus]|uniref:alpha/beta fold hydrolase n=1 Tax=Gracilibacillus alcaliphilus TaxID=1401441 RepID=UPI00195E171F|nr:alpha/beta hydrolase [Gracilibacillus alcaliphilus]MBM7678074.1 pimeloyl-ACP methyl ester carboxylesterase [Gracilibacillus alcaliphilus]